MAQLIREAVAAYIVLEEGEQGDFDLEAYLNDPLWQIPDIAEELGPSGFADGSVNHDSYLYEAGQPYKSDNESTTG